MIRHIQRYSDWHRRNIGSPWATVFVLVCCLVWMAIVLHAAQTSCIGGQGGFPTSQP